MARLLKAGEPSGPRTTDRLGADRDRRSQFRLEATNIVKVQS